MNLTNKQLDNYKIKLHRLINYPVVIYTNGRFEIGGLSDYDKHRILTILNKCSFVENVSESSKKYDFSDFDFSKGRPEPKLKYTIRGYIKEEPNVTEELELEEEVEIHDSLNPKIWTEDNKLIPEVERKIEEIVDAFVDDLKSYEVDIKIEDIYLLGSNANYNYTENSDLDIHIIADEDLYNCDKDHLPLIYQCMKVLFNNKYDITIHDIPVEVYVESKSDMTNVATGVYSLNEGWIKNPTEYEIPEIDQKAIDKEVSKWSVNYDRLMENPTVEAIDKYIDDIYDLRIKSLQKDGEFGEGNLIFKELRNKDILSNLKDLKVSLQSKELSLN